MSHTSRAIALAITFAALCFTATAVAGSTSALDDPAVKEIVTTARLESRKPTPLGGLPEYSISYDTRIMD